VVDETDDIKPTCINPFYVMPGKKPTQEDIEFMRDIMVAMVVSGGLDEKINKSESNMLLTAVMEVFDRESEGREVVLSDIYTLLNTERGEDGKKLANRFVEFTAGNIYGKLFDGPLQVNWDADMIVFETERMATSKAMPVVMIALFQQINVYCKWGLPLSRRKIIAVDEAWAVLANPVAAGAISGFYREMRKYRAGVILLSQTIKDFSNLINAGGTGAGGGILENTMHFFLLASAATDHIEARSLLQMNDEAINSWASVAGLPPYFSECFYRMRDDTDRFHSGKIRIYSNPLALWTATTTAEDRELRSELVKRYSKDMPMEKARRTALLELAGKYPLGYKHYLKTQAIQNR
jgi:hypothetical protein